MNGPAFMKAYYREAFVTQPAPPPDLPRDPAEQEQLIRDWIDRNIRDVLRLTRGELVALLEELFPAASPLLLARIATMAREAVGQQSVGSAPFAPAPAPPTAAPAPARAPAWGLKPAGLGLIVGLLLLLIAVSFWALN